MSFLRNVVNYNKFPKRRFGQRSSIDENEIKHFKKFVQLWWDPNGLFKPLHSMNKLRVPLIRDALVNIKTPNPLKGIKILEVGCGGGILTEPLARIGGIMTGVDANPDMINQAKIHAKTEKLQIDYVCSSIEDYATDNSNKYDAVVASEVIEHVSEKEIFLTACVQCLKPKGSFFLTTMNQTCFANFAGIFLAENVLKIVPKGTHQIEKFVKPQIIQRILEQEKCKTVLTKGLYYNFLTNEWFWSLNQDIHYAIQAVKFG